ncbi:hypothetical protein [Arcobacter sp. CECT 8985]|uniref:hypothetical protein n=1 Tax=Arcobacter sp. CECT 8985 TaxID=1935424 RepID=UPI00100BA4F2|nr:hypothetical protein [Arcobacter sp. CECT 8985]RXJ86278.1 hypothetical protein CRU93_09460 [Arcobacter sp. CECT 8985]
MKKIIIINILILSFLSNYLFASEVTQARVIGIFDKNGNGENVQYKKQTNANYNGTCFSKIVVIGSLKNKPKVFIGKSAGVFIKMKPLYNKYKIKIGDILIYKHENVSKGYVKITLNNKLYDYRIFVK